MAKFVRRGEIFFSRVSPWNPTIFFLLIWQSFGIHYNLQMKYADLFIIFRSSFYVICVDFMVTGRAPNRNETSFTFSHELVFFFARDKNHRLEIKFCANMCGIIIFFLWLYPLLFNPFCGFCGSDLSKKSERRKKNHLLMA